MTSRPAGEPLEDDDWDLTGGERGWWETAPRRRVLLFAIGMPVLVGAEMFGLFLLMEGLGAGIWAGLAGAVAFALFEYVLFRRKPLPRLVRWFGETRKGEYRGEWYLGYEGERRVSERRKRILAERARRAAQDAASGEQSPPTTPAR